MNDGGNNCIGVGLSGGVDSAAACLKLLESGHEVKGFTMLLSPDGEKTAEKGVAVARLLGIPHVVLDMREEFEQLILRRFVDEYAIGLTPSPCVVCNSCFKFGALWHAIVSHGCNALATGHYARTAIIEGCQALLRGTDRRKDQSYFLAQLTEEQLSHAIFPIGDSEKKQLKERIQAMGIVPRSESESQDLCFLPKGDFAQFVLKRRPDLQKDGVILDTTGKILGHHHGAFQYTVGQRRGLGLGGGPWFVARTDTVNNVVHVAHAEDLSCSEMTLHGMNWLFREPELGGSIETAVQIRYLMTPRPATLTRLDNGLATVHFHEPIMAAPPGQLAVAFDGERVVASGWISPYDGNTPNGKRG
ncbi:MAG: tRNA 2-thiouridine(34) synthase MnmA [Victivallales bacterium]|nr:tRNA 2-thiouridine(34) synthase MnmA [Victivallales bacterium]